MKPQFRFGELRLADIELGLADKFLVVKLLAALEYGLSVFVVEIGQVQKPHGLGIFDWRGIGRNRYEGFAGFHVVADIDMQPCHDARYLRLNLHFLARLQSPDSQCFIDYRPFGDIDEFDAGLLFLIGAESQVTGPTQDYCDCRDNYELFHR